LKHPFQENIQHFLTHQYNVMLKQADLHFHQSSHMATLCSRVKPNDQLKFHQELMLQTLSTAKWLFGNCILNEALL